MKGGKGRSWWRERWKEGSRNEINERDVETKNFSPMIAVEKRVVKRNEIKRIRPLYSYTKGSCGAT
jgi:hypothetical protein